jgi:hypothetical protein
VAVMVDAEGGRTTGGRLDRAPPCIEHTPEGRDVEFGLAAA